MYKTLYALIVLMSVLTSCKQSEKDEVLKLALEWQGKEIIYPEGVKFYTWDNQSIAMDTQVPQYKIFTYVDSLGCVSCELKLPEWSDFISEVVSLSPDIIHFQFVFQPHKAREIQLLLRREELNAQIFIDKQKVFSKWNKFPSQIEFHTFLLDKDNKVLAIGNPIHNPRVKDLYLKIIRGESLTEPVNEPALTTLSLTEKEVSFGNFDWQKKQKRVITLKNTGNHPLVIEDVLTSCGCVTIEYPREAIALKQKAMIQICYTAEYAHAFSEKIGIYCNVKDAPVELTVSGNAKNI